MPKSMNSEGAFLLEGSVVFEVHPARLYRVCDSGSVIPLDRLDAHVLGQFVLAPQTVLGGKQIMDLLWQQHDIRLDEPSVDEIVGRLRAILHALNPHRAYLRRLPRLGYAWVADVSPAGETAGLLRR